VRHPICEPHFRDLTTPCAADGCDMVGQWVIDWKGHLPDGTERTEEVRFWDEHWHQLQSSVAVTVNGVSMIHDGQGHFKALSGDVGRGESAASRAFSALGCELVQARSISADSCGLGA
jgi:hypothetical protein